MNSKEQPGFDAALAVVFVVLGATFGLLIVTAIAGAIYRAGKGFGLW